MDEVKPEEKKEDKPEEKPGDIGEGGKSKTDEEVERLNADTERINKAIAENENAKARQKLGGITEAGTPPEKPKEETPAEYTKRVSAGE